MRATAGDGAQGCRCLAFGPGSPYRMISWDRSRDWIVQRHYNDFTRVTVVFGPGTPTVAEFRAVRR